MDTFYATNKAVFKRKTVPNKKAKSWKYVYGEIHKVHSHTEHVHGHTELLCR